MSVTRASDTIPVSQNDVEGKVRSGVMLQETTSTKQARDGDGLDKSATALVRDGEIMKTRR